METQVNTISTKQKNKCAVSLMKRMLVKYAEHQNISFEEAMMMFTASSAYDILFDFETGIWKEGPDYLMQLFEESEKL